MNNFKKVLIVAGFALLAACGGGSDKFVGEWIDPDEKEVPEGTWSLKTSKGVTIKANGSSKVEITAEVMKGQKRAFIAEVDGDKIINGNRVAYTLDGNELVSSTGTRLVRK